MTEDKDEMWSRMKEGARSAGFHVMTDEEVKHFIEDGKEERDANEARLVERMLKNPYQGQYQWTDDMGEISGFDEVAGKPTTYEGVCRRMIQRGLEWLDKETQLNPKYTSFENVMGLATAKNSDAENFDKVLTAAATEIGDDISPTGAMHQAAVSHIMFARKQGWEKYCQEMRKRKR